jgi:hypothetical protein
MEGEMGADAGSSGGAGGRSGGGAAEIAPHLSRSEDASGTTLAKRPSGGDGGAPSKRPNGNGEGSAAAALPPGLVKWHFTGDVSDLFMVVPGPDGRKAVWCRLCMDGPLQLNSGNQHLYAHLDGKKHKEVQQRWVPRTLGRGRRVAAGARRGRVGARRSRRAC